MVKLSVDRVLEALNLQASTQDADGAVALLLKTVDQDFKVLFVKRVENPSDPWSGDIGFPGGKRDLTDRSLKQTVIRETLEETNINLLDRCRFLGELAAINSTRRPEISVVPFVVLLEHEPAIKLNRRELESFIWVSIDQLRQYRGTVNFSFGEFPAYLVGSDAIWGLTYRILQTFFKSVKNKPSQQPP